MKTRSPGMMNSAQFSST
ncbi:hypothetical protein RLOC_00009925 [Lonchura striata]|uniref:Uncharacterized protein n=1 Tax=Lonchura striata TaxID=40157 RepID=A0A218VA88_9PASE|nr:hypothetical protein RLOC_00009925 [Lonchura striata domestica]